MQIAGVVFDNHKASFLMKEDGEDDLVPIPVDDMYYSYEEQTFFTKLEYLHEDRKQDVPSMSEEDAEGEDVGHDGEDDGDLANQSDIGDMDGFIDFRDDDQLTIHDTSTDKMLDAADEVEAPRTKKQKKLDKIRQKIETEVRAELEETYREKIRFYEEREQYRRKQIIESEDEA